MAGVYSVVLGAEPCLVHYSLAAADVPIVTTNQDELVEKAAKLLGTAVDVLHLHGIASRPKTIVTMLSQYMEGLSIRTTRAMQARITGAPPHGDGVQRPRLGCDASSVWRGTCDMAAFSAWWRSAPSGGG